MRRELLLRWFGPIALAALLPLGMTACSQADQDRAEQTTDSAAGEARETGNEIGRSLDQLGEQARATVERAGQELRDDSKDVRDAAARNAVSAVLEGEFKRHGVDIKDTPVCNADSQQIGAYHVECTALTEDGKTANLVGDDPGDGPSNFVGTVEGQELFRQECIGFC